MISKKFCDKYKIEYSVEKGDSLDEYRSFDTLEYINLNGNENLIDIFKKQYIKKYSYFRGTEILKNIFRITNNGEA